MRIGYARVSTDEQNSDLQRKALEAAGCKDIFVDRGISGGVADRPGLTAAMKSLRAGDSLVVWKLDRLGRSLPHLIELIATLGERKVDFISLTESIDTCSAGGRLIFHIMGALSEFERALISERTRAGMAAAQLAGRHVGRPPALSAEKITHAQELKADGRSHASIARLLGVAPSTLYKYLRNPG